MNSQRLRLACLLWSALLLASPASHAQAPQTPFALPAFADTGRAARIEALLPEIDKLYQEQADKEHLPGLAYGILLDGKLIHAKGIGFANVEQKLAAAPDSRFRIASMSKSLVALAALKLRDEGKLRLDDPIAKYLPEAGKLRRPTVDSPAITVHHLMTMTTGLPEDNPWGDRQMELSNAALAKFVGGGLSFSTATGQGFEYSNLGFVMLGKVVSKASGMRFQDYVAQRILKPLGMADTGWEYASMPKDKLALGYRWTGSAWALEPMLHDGDAAAMGGLITTIQDWSRYSAFLLSAWPPRDEADNGPSSAPRCANCRRRKPSAGCRPRPSWRTARRIPRSASMRTACCGRATAGALPSSPTTAACLASAAISACCRTMASPSWPSATCATRRFRAPAAR
jgi:CubicO group peptidase (beta-lactamase class C family)